MDYKEALMGWCRRECEVLVWVGLDLLVFMFHRSPVKATFVTPCELLWDYHERWVFFWKFFLGGD